VEHLATDEEKRRGEGIQGGSAREPVGYVEWEKKREGRFRGLNSMGVTRRGNTKEKRRTQRGFRG